jgi:hypothetical protein
MEAQMTQLTELLREFSRLINDKHFDHRSGPQQLFSSFGGAAIGGTDAEESAVDDSASLEPAPEVTVDSGDN